MDIQQVKAWAFDKQMQLELVEQKLHQYNLALTQIAELVGLPSGESHPLQTIVDAVGAVSAKSKTQG